MTVDVSTLFVTAVGYLLLLFLVAYSTDRGWIPKKIAHHPITYVLSLGVYATSWSFYGSVGFADKLGYSFLTIYLGVTLAYILTPILLSPILTLTQRYQLTSLADLFAFRYRSQLVGMLVTLFMLAGTLPYLALQIRAISESIFVLTQDVAPTTLGLVLCVTLTLFAILFGARHISAREKHGGLVVAIAFESLIKLLALLSIGAFSLFGIFNGPTGLNDWLTTHPEALSKLYAPMEEAPWSTFMVLAFAAAFLLPRQFHMAFTENLSPRSLPIAAWGFPLFLLLLNLPIPLILWGGMASGSGGSPDYYVLDIAMSSGGNLLPMVAYIGGISSASAMVIVTSLALSSMCLNHLLLPVSYPDPKLNVYHWVLWGRRLLIGVIILSAYIFYLILEKSGGLVELGLTSFVAVAQFLPGIFGLLYWPRATRLGFILGLTGGGLIWAGTLLIPLLEQASGIVAEIEALRSGVFAGTNKWQFSTFWSLAVNSLLFVVFSLLSRPSDEENEAAQACVLESQDPPRGVVTATSPEQFTGMLEVSLGPVAAKREVQQALDDLQMQSGKLRPEQLRRLRERIERNLSGLVGPQMSRMIVETRLQLDPTEQTALGDSMRFIEERLEKSRTQLQGLALQLDELRRYHRQVLQDLPVGACSIGPANEVVVWNLAMEIISTVPRSVAVGTPLHQLPEPWGTLLLEFSQTETLHVRKRQVYLDGRTRSFNLHRASIATPQMQLTGHTRRMTGGMVILLEDLTDISTLEAELVHSERLASIGRLAAGVAHEIGNPVTGIACLAQNLRDEDDPEQVRQSINEILEQTRRIGEIVHTLVSFSHSGQASMPMNGILDLGACVDEAMRLVHLDSANRTIECINACPEQLQIPGDKQRLVQVFVNLLTNACKASSDGDTVRIDVEQDDTRVLVHVTDSGCGIPEELLDRVFEPFVTTREPGEGTGLGLPLVYSIVHDHGGTTTVRNNADRGARFSLSLPRHPQPTSKETDPA